MEKLSHLLALPVAWAQDVGATTDLLSILIVFIPALLLLLLIVASFVFWLWMLIDCLTRKFDDKLLWVIVLLGTFFVGVGFVGALIYYFVERKKLIKDEAQK